MRRVLWVWFMTVVVIVFLYVGVVALWTNRVEPTILGMPLLYTWFIIVPLLNPVILGALYLFDKKHSPQPEEVLTDVR